MILDHHHYEKPIFAPAEQCAVRLSLPQSVWIVRSNQGMHKPGRGAAQVPPDWGRSTLHTLTEGGSMSIKSLPAPPPILETFHLPKEGYRVFMVFNPMVANQNA